MVVLITALLLSGSPPALSKPIKLTADGVPIATDIGHPDPWVHDLNGDGKKDLLVGQFDGGKLRVYLNIGTDKSPKFGKFTYLQIAGKPASVPPS